MLRWLYRSYVNQSFDGAGSAIVSNNSVVEDVIVTQKHFAELVSWNLTGGVVGSTILGEVVMASDCLCLSGVVDYTDSISHCVCNKVLRPEL